VIHLIIGFLITASYAQSSYADADLFDPLYRALLETEKSLAQTPEGESNANHYYRLIRRKDYKDLSDAIKTYQAQSKTLGPSEEDFLKEVETYFANISNSLVLENTEAQLIVEMNKLHARAHGDYKEFENWLKLLELSRSLLTATQELPDNLFTDYPFRTQLSDLLRFAAKDYYIEASNLLLHDPSPVFVRPDQRGPKSLKEVLETSLGQHRPDKRYELVRFGIQLLRELPDNQEKLKVLDAFQNFESYLKDDLKLSYLNPDQHAPNEGGTDLVLNRLKDNEQYRFELRDLDFDPDFFKNTPKPTLTLSYVLQLMDSSGEVHELEFEFARDATNAKELSTSLQTSQLYEIIDLTRKLYSLESFLLMKLADQNNEPASEFLLEFRFFRRSPHPQIGLNMTPWYFPIGGTQNGPAVSELTNLGHQEHTKVSKEVSLLWEDLRTQPITWDQLVLIDQEKGLKKSIPIEDKAGRDRHNRILYSLHPFDPDLALDRYKYRTDSNTPLKLKLKVSLD